MSLMSVEELQEHVETDLGPAALQRLLDDADAEIVRLYGPHGGPGDEVMEFVRPAPGSKYITVSRPVSAVTEIVERVGDTETVLATDDYRVIDNGYTIDRLPSGTHARSDWAPVVILTYESAADVPRRKRVLIDLVRLAIQYTGLQSQGIGDYRATALEYEDERSKILERLRRGTQMLV